VSVPLWIYLNVVILISFSCKTWKIKIKRLFVDLFACVFPSLRPLLTFVFRRITFSQLHWCVWEPGTKLLLLVIICSVATFLGESWIKNTDLLSCEVYLHSLSLLLPKSRVFLCLDLSHSAVISCLSFPGIFSGFTKFSNSLPPVALQKRGDLRLQ
jgi:hypothetical protein